MATSQSNIAESRGEEIIYQNIDYSNPDILKRLPYKHRRSPIIVTLDDPKVEHVDIQKLMEAGMNVARFKTWHCTRGEQIKLIGKVDKATSFLCTKYSVLDWPVATCVELKTCIVRTGLLEGDEPFIILKEGTHVIITSDVGEFNRCTKHKIFVDNVFLTAEVKVGMMISIAQDEIVLQCTNIIDSKSINSVVVKSGELRNMSLVSIRGGKKARPLITKKDLHIVRFALEYQIDMIIINYSRQKETIRKVKEYIGKNVKRPILLAGVCTAEGIQNVDDLIKEADGIVFSREFLAYELEENLRRRLLTIQKWMGAKCQQAGKPFFVSGGVFKAALLNGEFLMNEKVDVTNAILDGATGFLLKDCPDTGKALEVLKELNELCCEVEPLTNTKIDFWRIVEGLQMPITAAQASALSCALMANQANSRVIIIPTVTGDTAKILMWLRPACLVLTVSTTQRATRRLQSYRCVIPLTFQGRSFYKNWQAAMNDRIDFAVQHAVKLGWLECGDSYVTLQRGTETSAFCDTVRAWTVTFSKKGLVECNDDDYLKEFHNYEPLE